MVIIMQAVEQAGDMTQVAAAVQEVPVEVVVAIHTHPGLQQLQEQSIPVAVAAALQVPEHRAALV
jgi:hypothetical protein